MEACTSDIHYPAATQAENESREAHGIIPLERAHYLLESLLVGHAMSFTEGRIKEAIKLLRLPRATYYRRRPGYPQNLGPAAGVTYLMAEFVRHYLARAAKTDASGPFDFIADRLGLGKRERQVLRPLFEYD